MKIMAANAQVEGADPAMYHQAAQVLSGKRGNLEARNEEYEAWSNSTARTRDIAEKAQRELERRGHEVPTWTPEDQRAEPETDEHEHQAETEPEHQAEAEPELEAETGPELEAEPALSEPGASPDANEPMVPEPEANVPEVAENAGPELEAESGVA
jgi:hypothetical protein